MQPPVKSDLPDNSYKVPQHFQPKCFTTLTGQMHIIFHLWPQLNIAALMAWLWTTKFLCPTVSRRGMTDLVLKQVLPDSECPFVDVLLAHMQTSQI